MYYQQGDVLLEKVDNVQGKKLDHLILQTGEATGHAHRISHGLAKLFEEGTTKYLHVISENAELTHEEHNTIVIPMGFYKVGRVREYDHFDEEVRNIRD